jgi:tetratricopeptide (TPR) repeat protein
MSKQHEKLMSDLNRLMATQNFKSVEEMKSFIESIKGKPIPSFPKEVLSIKEQAQDLVFEAYELPLPAARGNIEQALMLDPDLIEAFEYLGSEEETAQIAIAFFEKGVSIGRQQFDAEYCKANKGHFWGLHETRPFMRCMQQYADCLYSIGKEKESIAIMEEMIDLNPNDNQGVRDQLILYLIELNENKKVEKYLKMYEEDCKAFPLFNRALFTFKSHGDSEEANRALSVAIKQNKFVAKKLLAKKPIAMLADHYGLGDQNEVDYYAFFAQHIWQDTKDALTWLKKNAGTK